MCHFDKFLYVDTVTHAGNAEMSKALGMTSRNLRLKGKQIKGGADINIGEYNTSPIF